MRTEAILSQATCKPAAGTGAVTSSQVTVKSSQVTFFSTLPSVTGRFEERHNSINLESSDKNRESKERGLNGKKLSFVNKLQTRQAHGYSGFKQKEPAEPSHSMEEE